VTGIVQYKCRRTAWNKSRHTYIIDIGNRIEIPLVLVSPVTETRVISPPHPETRYFEIEVDEVQDRGQKIFVFQNIFPVAAGRKPDWYFMWFRIRRGDWMITERFYTQTPAGESQWIYTNDFNILFLSSGGRHDLEMLIHLITARLDEIAVSAHAGTPLPSQLESQIACREVLDAMFRGGVDRAFQDTVLYREQSFPVPPGAPPRTVFLSASEICRNHGRIGVPVDLAAELNLNLDTIEELDDLSWLYE
jgi:hypothetical protein